MFPMKVYRDYNRGRRSLELVFPSVSDPNYPKREDNVWWCPNPDDPVPFWYKIGMRSGYACPPEKLTSTERAVIAQFILLYDGIAYE